MDAYWCEPCVVPIRAAESSAVFYHLTQKRGGELNGISLLTTRPCQLALKHLLPFRPASRTTKAIYNIHHRRFEIKKKKRRSSSSSIPYYITIRIVNSPRQGNKVKSWENLSRRRRAAPLIESE